MSGACYRCGRAVPEVERIGRREACLGCGSELHCCRNCRFYDPRYHNQCRETQAERQVDKERANFCDYFSLGEAAAPAASPTVSPRAGLAALFSAKRKP